MDALPSHLGILALSEVLVLFCADFQAVLVLPDLFPGDSGLVHDANGVFKSGMTGSWKDQIEKSGLPDPSQPLKPRMGNDVILEGRHIYGAREASADSPDMINGHLLPSFEVAADNLMNISHATKLHFSLKLIQHLNHGPRSSVHQGCINLHGAGAPRQLMKDIDS